jgi:hypothetical protein
MTLPPFALALPVYVLPSFVGALLAAPAFAYALRTLPLACRGRIRPLPSVEARLAAPAVACRSCFAPCGRCRSTINSPKAHNQLWAIRVVSSRRHRRSSVRIK